MDDTSARVGKIAVWPIADTTVTCTSSPSLADATCRGTQRREFKLCETQLGSSNAVTTCNCDTLRLARTGGMCSRHVEGPSPDYDGATHTSKPPTLRGLGPRGPVHGLTSALYAASSSSVLRRR